MHKPNIKLFVFLVHRDLLVLLDPKVLLVESGLP